MRYETLLKAALCAPLLVGASLLFQELLAAETPAGPLEVLRQSIAADRTDIIARGMQLTDKEAAEFWPIYLEYRAASEKLGDQVIKLVLEYKDLYPNLPQDKALRLLKEYAELELAQAELKKKFIDKYKKVLPASKVLRYFQLENRLDLAVRVQLAGVIPLEPL